VVRIRLRDRVRVRDSRVWIRIRVSIRAVKYGRRSVLHSF